MKPAARGIKHQGAVLVEFAILLPILVILLLGTIEAGWALYIQSTINDAARQGARMAVTQNVSTQTIVNSVDTILQTVNITPTMRTITITPASVNLQSRGTAISIQVTVPYKNVSILPTSMFLGGVTLSSKVTMSKEY